MDERGERDDAVLPAMRVVALVVVAVLLPALVILWGMPGDTADLWAWTIKPDLTPIFMGAGYGAGAYFFTRVYLTKGWHEVSVGVISAAAFALLMLITTVLHFEKFNQGKAHDGLPDPPALATIAYYGWTIVYILSPWIVGLAVVAQPAARPARARVRRAARACQRAASSRASSRSARCSGRRSCCCRRTRRSSTGAGTSRR